MDNRSAAIKIVTVLRDAGHEAYLVGGCVRDMLLGKKEIRDHDVATSARPDEICALFRRARLVGAQFGVVLVGMPRQWIEVASFRTDQSYTDGRHPDEIRFATLEEDAQRRDFTVNGLYYDPVDGQVIDLVDGRKDLAARQIRAIGEPGRRFLEDYLRMLRAVRFVAQLEFTIEAETARAIARHAKHIAEISPERILEELRKLLVYPGRAVGLRTADELNLLGHILPEVSGLHGREGISFAPDFAIKDKGDAFEQTLAVLERLDGPSRFEPAMSALLHLSGRVRETMLASRSPVRPRAKLNQVNASARIADEICRRLTCSNRERHEVVWLAEFLPLFGKGACLSSAELKRMMMYGHYDDLYRLYRARVEAGLEPRANLAAIERQVETIDQSGEFAPEPLISGDDLSDQLDLVPGPGYQDILDAVFDAQLNGEIGRREDAMTLARRLAERHRKEHRGTQRKNPS
jgi:poly(A) polymerase